MNITELLVKVDIASVLPSPKSSTGDQSPSNAGPLTVGRLAHSAPTSPNGFRNPNELCSPTEFPKSTDSVIANGFPTANPSPYWGQPLKPFPTTAVKQSSLMSLASITSGHFRSNSNPHPIKIYSHHTRTYSLPANLSLNPNYGIKKFPCTEEGCTKSFTRRYNLSAHLRCHRQEKPFDCTNCEMKFARKHDLTRHIRSLHEMKRQFGPCGYCGSFFTRSDALARHVKVEAEKRGLGIVDRESSSHYHLHQTLA